MKIRQPVFIIIVGTNGTGKTTWLLERLSKSTQRQIVIDPDGMEKAWRPYTMIKAEDIARVKPSKRVKIIAPGEDQFKTLLKMKPGILVLDDCRYYVKANIEQAVRQILVRRRQLAIDIFAVAHSMNEVPATFWTYATHLLLFKTTDSIERSKQKIPKYPEIVELIKEVNQSENYHEKVLFSLKK